MNEQLLAAAIGAATVAALMSGLVGLLFRRLERRFDVVDQLIERSAVHEQRLTAVDGLAERTAVHEQRLTAIEGLVKETADDFYKLQLEHAGNHARARAG
jgi:Tfp pilus assembly protein PilN